MAFTYYEKSYVIIKQITKGVFMFYIEEVKSEIVKKLKPLNPDKIILFGSYSQGTANEESDIDLFILKDNLKLEEIRAYTRKARKSIRELIYKYQKGFDILSAPTHFIEEREDYFYKVDILEKGEVLYERAVG